MLNAILEAGENDGMIHQKKTLVDMTVSTGENWVGQSNNKELREVFGEFSCFYKYLAITWLLLMYFSLGVAREYLETV